MSCRSLAPTLLALAATGALGCGMLAGEGTDDDRPFVPDRAVVPWRVSSLEVCANAACDPAAVPALTSLDVLFFEGGFLVAAGRADGQVQLGDLVEAADGFTLWLDASPVLGPTEPWQGNAILHPDLVDTGDPSAPLGLVFGAAGAIGWAQGDRTALLTRPSPIATSSSLGLDIVAEPSAVLHDGKLIVAFRGEEGGDELLWTAQGGLGAELGEPLAALDHDGAALSAGTTWGPVSALGQPDIGLTPDGLLRLFFQGRARWAFRRDFEATVANDSIGYAAAESRGVFAPYANNPVFNRTFNFLFEADERGPSVAMDDSLALMLYLEARGGSALPAIAVHPLGR